MTPAGQPYLQGRPYSQEQRGNTIEGGRRTGDLKVGWRGLGSMIRIPMGDSQRIQKNIYKSIL